MRRPAPNQQASLIQDFSLILFGADRLIYCMSLSQDEATNTDPFLILYNHRKRKDSHDSTHARRIPHDYSRDRKSIILTRKMKARLEGREEDAKPDAKQEEEEEKEGGEGRGEGGSVAVAEESSEFFNKTELQKGIPLSDSQDEDILYNRNEMSWASNYSKLEKTLFGMNFPSAAVEEDEEEADKSEL